MRSKTYLFFILMLIQMKNCSSNLKCILNAFDKEKLETTKTQAAVAAHLNHLPTTENKILPKKKQTSFSDSPKGSLKGKLFQCFGQADPSIANPILIGDLTKDYLNSHQLVVPLSLKKWTEEQCSPYLSMKLNSETNSVYLCNQLIQKRLSSVSFMAKYQNVAYKAFGKLFSASGSEVSLHHREELPMLKYATTESQLKDATELIDSYYTQLIDEFLKAFDKNYNALMELVNSETTKNYFNFKDFLGLLLSERTVKLNDVHVAILLTVHNIGLSKIPESIQVVQNVLTEFKETLFEDVSSISFTRIADKINSKYLQASKATILFENIILPACVTKIHEFNPSDRNSVLKICNQLVQKLDDTNFLEYSFPIFVLEWKNSVEFLISAINKEAIIISQQFNDFDLLPDLVSSEWIKFLYNTHNIIEPFFPLLTIKEPDSIEGTPTTFKTNLGFKNVPLLLSLADIVSESELIANSILTPDFLNRFYEATQNNIFDSTNCFSFLEAERTLMFKDLKQKGKEIKMKEFMLKLHSRCRENPLKDSIELCIRVMNAVDFKKFLHYRYTDTIFELIHSNLMLHMKKFNIHESNEDVLTELGVNAVKSQLINFESELSELNKVDESFCKSQTDIKCKMYVMIAKSVLESPVSPIPTVLFKNIVDWVAANSKELQPLKLKNQAFSSKMNELKTYLSFKYLEDKKEHQPSFYDHIYKDDSNFWKSSLTPIEKKEIKRNLKTAFMYYVSLPETLRLKIKECSFSPEDVQVRVRDCEIKHKVSCKYINPFMLGKPCPPGLTQDQSGNCIADCPENFSVLNSKHCRKPPISIIQALGKTTDSILRCPNNFQQEGLLCIPKCPQFWKDFGTTCERPFIPFDHSSAVLLID